MCVIKQSLNNATGILLRASLMFVFFSGLVQPVRGGLDGSHEGSDRVDVHALEAVGRDLRPA